MYQNVYTNDAAFKQDILPFNMYSSESESLQEYHCHEYIQMWYVAKGKCIHHYEGQQFELPQGSLFIIPPYFYHSLDTKTYPNARLISCEFSDSLISSSTDQDTNEALFNLAYLEPLLIHCKVSQPSLRFTGQAANDLEQTLEELLDAYNQKKDFYSSLIKGNIVKLITLIIEQFQTTVSESQNALFSKYRSAINAALRYIDEHYTEKIYLEDICKMALMSPSSFSYIFRRSSGTTFTEYLQHKRILKAKELLLETNASIMEISEQSGFSDTAYFNRVFKKTVGVSPGQFRRDHL